MNHEYYVHNLSQRLTLLAFFRDLLSVCQLSGVANSFHEKDRVRGRKKERKRESKTERKRERE